MKFMKSNFQNQKGSMTKTNCKGKCEATTTKKNKKDFLKKKIACPVLLSRQNQIIQNKWQLVMKCRKIKVKLKVVGKYSVCSAIRLFVVVK